MAPLRRHPVAMCALLVIGGALPLEPAAAAAAAAASSPPRSALSSSSSPSSLFFGHLPRTRYPPAAQSWRATPPGAPVYAHLARGDVLAALVAANASSVPAVAASNAASAQSAADAPPPSSFSWCDVGGANLCAPSWQQHNAAMPPAYCGSCFLHATLSALQDRIKGRRHVGALGRRAAAASSASAAAAAASSSSSSSSSPALQQTNLQDVLLGRQAFLNCAPVHGLSKGCNGGEPLDVYHYMARFGLPDEGCVPYSATDHTRFEKKKKPTAAAAEEADGQETSNEEEDGSESEASSNSSSWSDAAPTAAEALRSARGGDSDNENGGGSSTAAEYLLRGDPKCRGPKRGKRQCMNCMPLPDDPKKKKKEEPEDDDDQDPIPAECWAVERPLRYGVSAFGKVAAGEEEMQKEILARGPVVCGIACPEKFVYGYQGGVYVDDGADKELDHDVEVVGWGEEEVEEEQGEEAAAAIDGDAPLSAAASAGQNATAAAATNNKPNNKSTKTTTRKYWLVRNSWGTYWGELGFFKLERGANALQIESGEDGTGDCWWAEPDLAFEDDVARGQDWLGSMHGIRPKRQETVVRAVDEGLAAGGVV